MAHLPAVGKEKPGGGNLRLLGAGGFGCAFRRWARTTCAHALACSGRPGGDPVRGEAGNSANANRKLAVALPGGPQSGPVSPRPVPLSSAPDCAAAEGGAAGGGVACKLARDLPPDGAGRGSKSRDSAAARLDTRACYMQ